MILLVCYRYIIVVEHDLSVLDYLSDFICCLYGVPSAYGVVTMPFSVREGALLTHSQPRDRSEEHMDNLRLLCLVSGINIFLDGYVPTENLRFRETSLVFKVAETANEEEVKRLRHYQVRPHPHFVYCVQDALLWLTCLSWQQYPEMKKTMGEFSLEIKGGEFTDSEIMVMLGENGEFVASCPSHRFAILRFSIIFLNL